MVKIYLEDKEEPINVRYSSILKAFIMAWGGLIGIVVVVSVVVSFFLS